MAQTSFYSVRYENWPPTPVAEIARANSEYWHEEAIAVCRKLADRMCYEAYCEWIDAQSVASWKALHDLVVAKMQELDEEPQP